jgi:hypothetical protein
MGTVPTNAAFKKITSNNITDDYIQLIRGSDKTVLLWVDAAGIIQGKITLRSRLLGPTKAFNSIITDLSVATAFSCTTKRSDKLAALL